MTSTARVGAPASRTKPLAGVLAAGPRWLWRRKLRLVVLSYLALLVGLPVVFCFEQAFASGFTAFWREVSSPGAVAALWLSVRILIVVLPANTLAGILAAMLIARRKVRGRRLLDMTFDIPVAVSPVIIGIAMLFAYSRVGWFGDWLLNHGIQLVFSPWAIAIATAAVSLPYVLRSIVPVLVELGENQEQAARTLGAGGLRRFLTVTLPGIRWGLLFGMMLTLARILGEFGAVLIVSGNVSGVASTQTLTLWINAQYEGQEGSNVAPFSGAVELVSISIAVLVVLSILRTWERRRRVDLA